MMMSSRPVAWSSVGWAALAWRGLAGALWLLGSPPLATAQGTPTASTLNTTVVPEGGSIAGAHEGAATPWPPFVPGEQVLDIGSAVPEVRPLADVPPVTLSVAGAYRPEPAK